MSVQDQRSAFDAGISDDAFARGLIVRMPRFYRAALSRTRQWHDAEDLLQQTLLKAWNARQSFAPETNMDAWLATIMRHAFHDQLRTVHSSSDIDDFHDDVALSTPASQDVGLHLEDLSAALDRLPETQRAAVLAIGMEGLSYEETAERTAVPTGTIRSRVGRGRAALQSLMTGEEMPVMAGD